ncbi:MAG: hypothetical protein AAGE52_16025 [Myxococcota bacterium]
MLILLGIGAGWAVAAPPWGLWSWTRNLPLALAGLLPWIVLSRFTLRRDARAPWLALGACAASLPLGPTTSTFFPPELFAAFGDLVRVTPLIAALLIAHQSRLAGWRERVSSVAIGGLLVWVPIDLYLAIDGLVAPKSSWGAPNALVALLPAAVGIAALLRRRAWGLGMLLFVVPAVFLVVVPEPRYTCFGPRGHPFAYGWSREFVAACSAVTVAPWIRPAFRFLTK